MVYSVSEAKTEFENLLNRLVDECGFDTVLSNPEAYGSWHWQEKNHDNFVESCSGATRAVLYTDDSKYVFKFQYKDFEYDYGRNELGVYKLAKDRGCVDAFAWTDFIGTYGELDVYVQEKCDADEERISSDSYDYHFNCYCNDFGYDVNDMSDKEREDIYDRMDSEEYESTDGMVDFASSQWSSHLYAKFIDLMDAIDLNDLHSGNFGYNANGGLVVIDFAGYDRDFEF